MNIHEYQAKQFLREYGIPVLDGRIIYKAEEAKTAAGELDGPLWVVKAQIHAGGRGAGTFLNPFNDKGGVQITNTVEDAKKIAKGMMGNTLITKQTGSEGKLVNITYKGRLEDTLLDLLGGVRSTCTYIGAKKIKDISKCTTFVCVNNQLNNYFN